MSSILTDTAERLNEMLNSRGISLRTRAKIIAAMMPCIGSIGSIISIAKNRCKYMTEIDETVQETDETVQETDGTDIMSVQTDLLSAVRTALNIYANTSS